VNGHYQRASVGLGTQQSHQRDDCYRRRWLAGWWRITGWRMVKRIITWWCGVKWRGAVNNATGINGVSLG